MKVTRIYSGADGRSRFEDVAVALQPAGKAEASRSSLPRSLSFHRFTGPGGTDWHPAPTRQFVVVLGGAAEVEVGDGSVRRFGPGAVLFVEDTEGSGHITRTVEPGRRHLHAVMPDDFDIRSLADPGGALP